MVTGRGEELIGGPGSAIDEVEQSGGVLKGVVGAAQLVVGDSRSV